MNLEALFDAFIVRQIEEEEIRTTILRSIEET